MSCRSSSLLLLPDRNCAAEAQRMATLSLKPPPVDPGAQAKLAAARDDYQVKFAAYLRQEEIAYSLVMESSSSSTTAMEVAMLYHKDQEAADPPRRHSGN